MGCVYLTSAYGHRRRTAQQPRRRRSTKRTSSPRDQERPPPGERPAPLSEVARPQSAVTVGYVAAGVPLLGAPSMASPSAEAIDESTLSFLLAENLARVKEEEEEEEKEEEAVLARRGRALVSEVERFVRSRGSLAAALERRTRRCRLGWGQDRGVEEGKEEKEEEEEEKEPVMAERAVRSAARRRERWLRSMWRHEQLSVRMAVATASHHSWKSHAVVGTQTEYAGVAGPAPVIDYVAPAPAVAPFSSPAVSFEMPAPVVEYVAHAPAVTYAAPAPVVGYVSSAPAVTFAAHAPVIDYVAPAPSVTYAAPAPVFEYVAPAPVFGFIAPAPAVSFVAPSQQLRPAYADDAAVEVSASQVVGSLPHGEVFAAPMFHQVHHVPLAGGEIPENFVEIPVVPEQVIPLRVVDSLPHAEEFTASVARRPPPQTVDSVMEVLRFLDCPLVEQVISVPRILCSPCPSRSCVSEPQSADQLVEVPTVLTPTRIALQIAEQIVDTSVPRGRARGSLPVHSSAAQATSARRRFTGTHLAHARC